MILRRATLIASVDEPGAAEAAEAWLDGARDGLSHVSDQLGCGCCVVIWEIEGPEELVATLPDHLRGYSDWDPVPKPPSLLSRLCRLIGR